MATKVKPSRLQITGTPQAGNVPVYVDQDTFQWGAGGGGGSGDVSGPASSTDGDIALFDGATGKKIKDSSKKLSDITPNVKVFTLSSTSDTTNASKAYAYYTLGNTPIIIYNSETYVFMGYSSSKMTFYSVRETSQKHNDTGKTTIYEPKKMEITIVDSQATAISVSQSGFVEVLDTDTNYTTPYTPQYDGSPATKKYVDDGLALKANSSSLGTASTKNTGTSSGNVPVLDSNGKLATSTLPGVALTDTFTVSTSSDLTSLSSAEQGDLAIVTSENKTYVLAQSPYSTSANWKEILSPTAGVTSVNGQTGAVTLSIPSITSTTATLTVAGWSSSTQTVSVTGVTATNTVIVSPAPANIDDYAESKVYGYTQGTNSLTFKCTDTPTGDIDVNVVIMN